MKRMPHLHQQLINKQGFNTLNRYKLKPTEALNFLPWL